MVLREVSRGLDVMAVTNELLFLGLLNLVWRKNLYKVTCLSTTMATVRKFEVISNIIKVYRTLRKHFLYINKIIRSLK